VKRGLITWDKNELPPEVFQRRTDIARKVLMERGLPALVVYSDLWRSNQARFFANYMPYFNRALLILPVEGKPTLLCGLSPRTYRWIQSVTPIEDVRSAGNFVKPLTEIATERGWRKVGVLDAPQLPYDLSKALRSGPFEIVNVESAAVFHPEKDDYELAMRRKAAAMARTATEKALPEGVGKIDYEFVGELERNLRMAGAEDLVILLTNGDGPPAPACGRELKEGYSVSLALEYRGHWVHIAESRGPAYLRDEGLPRPGSSDFSHRNVVELLSGPYPYECRDEEGFVAQPGEIVIVDKRYVVGVTSHRKGGSSETL
jgi:hypothetical protein